MPKTKLLTKKRMGKNLMGGRESIRVMREKSGKLLEKLDELAFVYEGRKQTMLMFGTQLRKLEERVSRLEAKRSRR